MWIDELKSRIIGGWKLIHNTNTAFLSMEHERGGKRDLLEVKTYSSGVFSISDADELAKFLHKCLVEKLDGQKRVFVVGKAMARNGKEWEFQGVFDSEKLAIAACVEDCFFVGPAIVNEQWPSETVDWADAWYPRLQEKPTSFTNLVNN